MGCVHNIIDKFGHRGSKDPKLIAKYVEWKPSPDGYYDIMSFAFLTVLNFS